MRNQLNHWVLSFVVAFTLPFTGAAMADTGTGDFNLDADVDLQDAGQLLDCFSGADPAPVGCEAFDFDGDARVTLADYALFRCRMAGPGVVAAAFRVDEPTSPTTETVVTLNGVAGSAAAVRVIGGVEVVVAPVEDCAFSVEVELRPDAVNALFVLAVLGDGTTTAPVPVTIRHDLTGPNLFIDFPPDDADLTTAAVDVAGRVGDVLSGFMGLEVTVIADETVEAIVDVGIGNNGTFFAQAVPLALGRGTITVIATDVLGNTTEREITITRVEIPPDAPTMGVVSGNAQAGQINTNLAEPIVVEVNHADGTPFADKFVTFTVTRSNGRLTEDGLGDGDLSLQLRTDADGLVEVFWRLGTDAGCGNNRVEVTSTSIVGSTFFCASAMSAPAVQINVGAGNNQRAEVNGPATEPLRVWVSDACNGANNVSVTYDVIRGWGKVNGLDAITVSTSVTGHAEVDFVLGPEAGVNIVEASFPGNPGESARFVLTGIARDENLPTTFTGVVLDNADQAIQGATCRLVVAGVPMDSVDSDIHGQFRFEDIPGAGPADLFVDGLPAFHLGGPDGVDIAQGSFPALHFTPVLIPNTDNTLSMPILLPPLNPNNAVVFDNTRDVELTVEGIDGLRMLVRAGSMRRADGSIPNPSDPAILTLNQVNFDKVPMPMPDGAAPPFAWTLQPAGARFNPPVGVVYPNMSGLEAGSIAYFLSFDHDTNKFEIVASGHVTDDGSCIESDPGAGIAKAGWGCNCPPYSVTGDCCKCDPEPNGCGPAGYDALVPDCPSPILGLCFRCFSSACDTHDICYGTCGSSQADCDLGFFNDMMAICDTCPLGIGQLHCAAAAYIYYQGVSRGGAGAHSDAQQETCDCCEREGCCGSPPVPLPGSQPPESPFVDNDLDLMPDDWETESGLDPTNPDDAFEDPDEDGLPNLSEFLQLTDPFDPDSDGNGINDGDDAEALEPVDRLLLDDACTVTVNGQTVPVGSSGTFTISNIAAPDQFGPGGPGSAPDFLSDDFYRAVAVCVRDGVTSYGVSDCFQIAQGQTFAISSFTLVDGLPQSIESISASPGIPTLTEIGQTTVISITGTFADGTVSVLLPEDACATFRTSNAGIITVDETGLAEAVGSGTVFATATVEGATSVTAVTVSLGDPLTTVEGIVQLPDGTPAEGASITFIGLAGEGPTGADGHFSIPGIASLQGPITVRAELFFEDSTVIAWAFAIPPVPDGVTDAGILGLLDPCDPDYFVPLGYGMTAEGVIPVTPQCDTWMYAFDADAGDLVTISVDKSTNFWVTLTAPDGTTVFSESGGDARWLDVRLYQTGAYRLGIRSFNGTEGTFRVGLSDQAIESLPPLTLNLPAVEPIEPYGDVDERVFVGVAGEVVSVYADATNPLYVDVRLLDTDRHVVATGGSVASFDSQIIRYAIPMDGDYTVQVYPRFVAVANQIGEYTVSIDAGGVNVNSIAYGETAIGGINFGADVVCYEFNATLDDITTITLDTSTTFWVSLTAPDGSSVFEGSTADTRWLDLHLYQTGAYRLMISSFNGTQGTFTISLSDQPIESLPPITPGAPVADTIDPFGDVDEWPLSAAAGELVTIYADAGNPLYVDIRLLDANRGLVASGVAIASFDSQLVDFAIPATGDYIIQIVPRFLDISRVGPYTLSVDTAAADVRDLAYGESAAGAIGSGSDTVVYAFDATAGDVATITVDTSTTFWVSLTAPDGTAVFAQSASDPRWLDMTFYQTGTYALLIRSNNGSQGTFSVALSDQPVEALPALELNAAVAEGISPFGDVDDHAFAGTAGQVVSIYVDTASPLFLDVRLLNAQRNMLALGATVASFDSQIVDYMLPEDGDYIVQVVARFVGTTYVGAYTITIDSGGVDVNDIAYGETAIIGITSGADITCYQFEATAGDLTTITLDTTATFLIALMAPDGSMVFSGSFADPRWLNLHLYQTGFYNLVVRSLNGSQGTATLSLSDQPIETLPPLTLGAPTADAIVPFGDVDDRVFTASAGDVVTLFADAGNPLFVDVRLLDEHGHVLAVGTSIASFDSQILNFTIPATGDYKVQVIARQVGTQRTGAYTLSVNPGIGGATACAPGTADPMAYGDRVAGSINSGSDLNCYAFAVIAGDVTTITLDTTTTFIASLLAPDDSVVFSLPTTDRRWQDLELYQSGDYQLIMGSSNGSTGTFVVGLSDQAVEALAPLAFNEAVSDTIYPYGDVDERTFSATAGQVVSIHANANNPLNMIVRLLDASRIVLATGTTIQSWDSQIVGYTIPENGDYIVQVVAASLDITRIGPYVLWADTGGVELGSLEYGETASGTIASGADIHCYEWNATAGDITTITLESTATHFATLLAPDGGIVFSRSALDVRWRDLHLYQDGTYRFVLRSLNGSIGPFDLALSNQPVESLPALSVGDRVVGSIFPYGDVDDRDFMASAGETISLYANSMNPLTAELRLLNADRDVMTTGLPLATYDSQIVNFTIPENGTYIVQVISRLLGDLYVGDYTLSIDAAAANVHSIGYGETALGSIDTGSSSHTYAFSATSGDLTTISLDSTTTFAISLTAPDGSLVFAQNIADRRWRDLRLYQTGTYHFAVQSINGTTGTFTVALSDQAIESLPPLFFETPAHDLIAPFGDVDERALTATAGQVINVFASTVSPMNVDVRLLDLDHNVIATGIASSVNSQINSFTIPYSGTFLLQVMARTIGIGYSGPYTLSVDAPGIEVFPLAYGESASGSIGSAAEIVCYDFTAIAGDIASLAVDSPVAFLTELKAPDGTIVASRSGSDTRWMDVRLYQTGVYRLCIRSVNGSLGAYTVGLSDQPIESLDALSIGVTEVDSISPFGDVDDRMIALSGGDVVTIYADSNWPSAVDVRLLDTDRLLMTSGTTASTYDSQIVDFIVPVTGDYVVQVNARTVAANAIGGYTLQIDSCSAGVTDIAYGETRTAAVNHGARHHCFTFDAASGDFATITIDSTTTFFGSLMAPDGTVIFAQNVADTQWLDLLLTQTGTYRIVIQSLNGSLGSFTLALSDQPIESLPALIFNERIDDTVFPFGDVDEWSLSGVTGQRISIYADATSPLSLTVRLLDSFQTVIATGTALSVDSQLIDFELPFDGVYIVQVIARGLTTANVGTYALSVDSPQTAVTPLAYGDTATGSIAFGSDVDTFSIAATAGDIATITLATSTTYFATLLAPDGSEIFAQTASNIRWLDLVFDQTGTYTLRVRSNNNTQGTYGVSLSDQPTEPRPAVVVNVPVSASMFPFGDVDEWTFSATNGQVVTILTDSNNPMPTSVRLLNAAREVVATGTTLATYDSRILDFTIPATGDYIIHVSSRLVGTVYIGNYVLTVTE